MAAPTVSVTVEYLDELLADGTYDHCKAFLSVRVLGVRVLRSRRCQQKAVAVITITCSRHGTQARGICREHLRLAKKFPDEVRCGGCGERATWSGGGV